jgi:hypothetical protein
MLCCEKIQGSKAQVRFLKAFAKMSARRAALDADEKREKKAQKVAGEPIVLRQYASGVEEEQEQKTVPRKKKQSKKKIVYETEYRIKLHNGPSDLSLSFTASP